MKRIIISFLLLINTYSAIFPMLGTLNQYTYLPFSNTPVIARIQQPYETFSNTYSASGTTFYYTYTPTILFNNTPIVFASIVLNGSSDQDSYIYTAVVSANSSISCTIIVYKLPLVGGAITEAASNEVDLFIFALGNN